MPTRPPAGRRRPTTRLDSRGLYPQRSRSVVKKANHSVLGTGSFGNGTHYNREGEDRQNCGKRGPSPSPKRNGNSKAVVMNQQGKIEKWSGDEKKTEGQFTECPPHNTYEGGGGDLTKVLSGNFIKL